MKKTKKAVSLAAALLLALSLTACGKSEEAQAVDDPDRGHWHTQR